jgi:hypothetical protein
MIINMGSLDRRIRFIFAVIVAVLYFTKMISGAIALVLGIVALAFALTSFIGFCPIYYTFKINIGK